MLQQLRKFLPRRRRGRNSAVQRDPLQLDDSLHFSSAGLVAGFGVPDALDLRDIAFILGTTVERQSWWHPQEPTCDEWWADVLADPRARKRERRTDLAVKQAFYRLADEKRKTILVAFRATQRFPERTLKPMQTE
jgi:hypothetical protein